MEKILERLEELREKGKMVITPDYYVSYNPFRDVYILDVPEDRKCIWLNIPQSDFTYTWEVSGLYPVEVDAARGCDRAWKELEPYIRGATIDLLPTFTDNGKEYVWFDMEEEGAVAVLKDEITKCK